MGGGGWLIVQWLLQMMRLYSAIDLAEAIGSSLDTLYRTRQLRHDRDACRARSAKPAA